MNILILGGSPDHLGGVETFCDRAAMALRTADPALRVDHINTGTAYLTLRRLPIMGRGIAALVRYRLKGRAVVWLHYVNLPDLAYLLLCRLLGLRVMVTPHLGANWRSQSNPVLRWLSGTLLSLANRIALIAKTQASEIRLPASVPHSLITTFLPEEVMAPVPVWNDRPDRLLLLHASRLSEAKGTFLVVDVCARLRDAGVPFSARIIGGADEETYARLRAAIAAHGLQDEVELIGWTPPADLMEHLRRADVLVHLSRIDSYPLIVLEGLACGMFPIALDLAGARDMVANYDGHIVGEAAPVEETAAFLIAADREDLRRRSADEALKVRADFNWDRAAALLRAALAETASGVGASVERSV